MLDFRMALAPGARTVALVMPAHALKSVIPAHALNPVIPANAGIQSSSPPWTPAFAGVTNRRVHR
jgi:hypothetical protein